jgi:20S proteasome alpha/beta subunit
MIHFWLLLLIHMYFDFVGRGSINFAFLFGLIVLTESKCCRYYSDPSGVFYLCNAKAIGLQSEAADTHLEEHSNRVFIFLLCVL